LWQICYIVAANVPRRYRILTTEPAAPFQAAQS
jgi:hypothetical protein